MKYSIESLGPLSKLVGTWEGQKGDDTAPSDDRGTEKNYYRERMVFEPLPDMVNNHEQTLYGLRYSTTAWRIGEPDPFHEEVGYWLWDAKEKQVMRCFLVPRGVSVIAGGEANANDSSFKISAELGSATYGICSNKFLDREFKTVRYDLHISVSKDGILSYEEDTVLQMKGKKDLFHHIDKNSLKKV